MERLWMTLDQIKAEYASSEYNPELLLQHLLHHVEASPASVLGGWVEWMQNIDSAMKEPIFQEARALMGTENYGQDVSLLQALRLVRRRMLAAAPTPPSAEDRKAVGTAHTTPGASGFTMCVFNVIDVPVGTVLYTMQEDKSCAK